MKENNNKLRTSYVRSRNDYLLTHKLSMKNFLKILTTCSLMLFVTSPAFADSETDLEETATEKMEDIKAAIEAIDAGDYDAWADAVEGRKITEIINEDNFDDFV